MHGDTAEEPTVKTGKRMVGKVVGAEVEFKDFQGCVIAEILAFGSIQVEVSSLIDGHQSVN